MAAMLSPNGNVRAAIVNNCSVAANFHRICGTPSLAEAARESNSCRIPGLHFRKRSTRFWPALWRKQVNAIPKCCVNRLTVFFKRDIFPGQSRASGFIDDGRDFCRSRSSRQAWSSRPTQKLCCIFKGARGYHVPVGCYEKSQIEK